MAPCIHARNISDNISEFCLEIKEELTMTLPPDYSKHYARSRSKRSTK